MKDDHFVFEVSEYCGECDSYVVMEWNVELDGYKAFCPYCGERLMLCDACLHADDNVCKTCDWSEQTNLCFRLRTPILVNETIIS